MKQRANRKIVIFMIAIMTILLVPITAYAENQKPKTEIKEKDAAPKEEYKEIIASYYKKLPAGSKLNIEDILVAITYSSGKVEITSGLSNFCFVNTKDTINKTVKNKDGSVSKISETVTEESKIFQVKNGVNKIMVRLKDSNPEPTDSTQETVFYVEGIEDIPPELAEIEVSDFEVGSYDKKKDTDITVTLKGEDNYSKAADLRYAFKLKEEAISDNEFSSKKEYTVKVKQNCTYMAYVKDQAGNIAKQEVPIMLVDKEVPVIKSTSLAFNEEDGWVTKNIIYVEAADNYKPDKSELLKYRFTLKGTSGSETKEKAAVSGNSISTEGKLGTWLNKNSIVVVENGTYNIEVMDFAGNIAKDTIEVKDIDGEVPQIQGIEIKETKTVEE